MLGFRLIGTLGALVFASAAYGQEALALPNAEEPAQQRAEHTGIQPRHFGVDAASNVAATIEHKLGLGQ